MELGPIVRCNSMTRMPIRCLLLTLLLAVSARAETPPEQEAAVSAVKATSLAEMAPNSGKVFKFGRKPALIVRQPDGTFRAFLAKCTHLDCVVQYREDKERIWCACHDGFYDLNGTNVSGPPPRPLDALEVHMQGDDVYVTRKS